MTSGIETLNAITDIVLRYNPHQKSKKTGKKPRASKLTFWEFFAGGGMARAGLGDDWQCLFANDFDLKKSASYRDNWKDKNVLLTKDVAKVTTDEVPGTASLVWASFPCQDLSLAGMGAGLKGDRSGTFWPFWHLMGNLMEEGRAPKAMVLENVCGTLTSHGGKDFIAIAEAVSGAGYKFGAVVIDAADFVPQSRQRLFIIAVADSAKIPGDLVSDFPDPARHPKALINAYSMLEGQSHDQWVWWKLPAPDNREQDFIDLIEDEPSVKWHSKAETEKLLAMMSPVNLKKVEASKKAGRLHVGTVYKRTRLDENGNKVQRAEVRFDNISGCLRTSAGGSSRQIILLVKGDKVRSRLISTRETARLMGLPDSYILPKNYNEAYHLTGDGVVVPVVRYLAESILEPVLKSQTVRKRATA